MKALLILISVFALLDTAFAKFMPRAFQAELDQVITSRIGNKKKTTPVTMKYLFSNNLIFDVKSEDSPLTYVCNKTTTWMYQPPWDPSEKGEVKIGESSKYCYVKIFDALSNGLKSNKLYSVKKDGKEVELEFNKIAMAQTQIRKAKIYFKNAISNKTSIIDVDYMELWKLDEKKPLTFKFKSFDTKRNITVDDFTFKVPENTNKTSF